MSNGYYPSSPASPVTLFAYRASAHSNRLTCEQCNSCEQCKPCMQCQSVNSFGDATSIYNGIFYLHVLHNTSVRSPQNYHTLKRPHVIIYIYYIQGGRTWQAFGRGKHGHETFRQARNYNLRDKCVVFARNLKFSNLTQ